jgi:hypothetical protein
VFNHFRLSKNCRKGVTVYGTSVGRVPKTGTPFESIGNSVIFSESAIRGGFSSSLHIDGHGSRDGDVWMAVVEDDL